jgi:GNAT superfamily N-acetyltransferase
VTQAPSPQHPPGRITVTYLEIADPRRIEPPSHPRPPGLVTREVTDPTVNRDMYRDVGADYHWTDRLVWGDREWRTWSERVETRLVELDGTRVGYFEIEREGRSGGPIGDRAEHRTPPGRSGGPIGDRAEHRTPDCTAAKIAIFGLLRDFQGRGLGGHALTLALQRAFEVGPRVWLTTCTLDGPNALPNYLTRGMEVFREEQRPWSG